MKETDVVTPQFELHVFCSRFEMISAGLEKYCPGQVPYDEESQDYMEYTVKTNNARELVEIANKIFERRITFEFAVRFETPDTKIFACTGSGYCHPPEPKAFVEIDRSKLTGDIGEAARKAAEILREAIA